MNYHLRAANSKLYDHASAFEHYGYIDWRQSNYKYEIGDILFLYCTEPIKKIWYHCLIEKINMQFKEIRDDKEYWHNIDEYYKAIDGKFMRLKLLNQIDSENLSLYNMRLNGLKGSPQGSRRLHGEILDYIINQFNEGNNNELFFTEVETNANEGSKIKVYVNKYERSSIARAKCVSFHGYKCSVCGFDFTDKYGEIGKGFIHVHHKVPLYKISKEYKINYKDDLIPVCPNCHAMLHRNRKEVLSIEALKGLIASE